MNEFHLIAAAVVTVLSAARLTRLLTIDEFPPIAYFRDIYEKHTEGNRWQALSYCAYCMSPWMTALVVLFGWLCGVYGTDPFHSIGSGGHDPSSGDATAWWIINGIFAASYPAAILVRKDGDE